MPGAAGQTSRCLVAIPPPALRQQPAPKAARRALKVAQHEITYICGNKLVQGPEATDQACVIAVANDGTVRLWRHQPQEGTNPDANL